uniref:Uncharacterized protein n=1 Tax=viral metagenome TaxID=1070528 RepID=A0A6C0C6P5_9ZZZZ
MQSDIYLNKDIWTNILYFAGLYNMLKMELVAKKFIEITQTHVWNFKYEANRKFDEGMQKYRIQKMFLDSCDIDALLMKYIDTMNVR